MGLDQGCSAVTGIIGELERYEPDNQEEADYHHSVAAWLRSASAPFNRTCYQPGHIVASAFVLTGSTDGLALIFHRKLQRWLQPGGHLTANETTPADSARREAEEELGLKLRQPEGSLFDLDVHRIPRSGGEPSHLHFDFRYLFRSPQIALHPGSDALEAQWFSLRDAELLASDAGLRRAVRKCMQAGRRGV
jgi:8-oxo-dGTP pyrophosphatase MutT (NUDIX family)